MCLVRTLGLRLLEIQSCSSLLTSTFGRVRRQVCALDSSCMSMGLVVYTYAHRSGRSVPSRLGPEEDEGTCHHIMCTSPSQLVAVVLRTVIKNTGLVGREKRCHTV